MKFAIDERIIEKNIKKIAQNLKIENCSPDKSKKKFAKK